MARETPSSSTPFKGEVTGPNNSVDTMGRKVWDKDYYARRLNERIETSADDADIFLPETKKPKMIPPLHERKTLQKRSQTEDLEKDLGKIKMITPHTPKMHQGGYWCKTCECLIKDSQAYLDHINGKKHNRLLGMTMNVEKVSAKSVREKLEALKNPNREVAEMDDVEYIQKRIQLLKEQEEKRKQRKKHKKAEKYQAKQDDSHLSAKQAIPENSSQHQDPIQEDLKSCGLPLSFSGK